MNENPFAQNPTVCFCHAVRLKELLEAIQKGATTLYDLQLETLATTGCGGCESDVIQILECELEKKSRKASK